MKRQRGISVIELMVGLALMTVAVLGLNSLAISAIRGNLTARLVDQATHLAQQKLEQTKRAGYAAAVPSTTIDANVDAGGNAGGHFTRTTVIAAGALATTRTVTVTIAWTDYGMRQTLFATQIAP